MKSLLKFLGVFNVEHVLMEWLSKLSLNSVTKGVGWVWLHRPREKIYPF